MVAIDIGTFFDTVLAWLQNTWTSLCADFYLNFIKEDRWKYLVRGLGVTLEVALFAAIAGIILGALLAIIRTTADKTGRLRFLNWLAKLYITVIRGTPVVVQLLIINFVIFSSVFVDTVLVAIIAFGLNSAAYVAEVFRSGIMSIDEGQFEAGRSLGFNYGQTMWHIVMPQAFKKRFARACQRIHHAFKGNFRFRLHRTDGSYKSGRHHPQPHACALHAAAGGRAGLPYYGSGAFGGRIQAGKEASQWHKVIR